MSNFDEMRRLAAELFVNWQADMAKAVSLVADLANLHQRMMAADNLSKAEKEVLAKESLAWLDKWDPVKSSCETREMIASLSIAAELAVLQNGRAGLEAKLATLPTVEQMREAYAQADKVPYVRRTDES